MQHAVASSGEAARAGLAVEALVLILCDDPRIRSFYAEWRGRHGFDDALIERLRNTADPADVLAFGEALHAAEPHDLRQLRELCASIGVSYEWVPTLILAQYQLWAYTDAKGDAPQVAIGVRPGAGARQRLPDGRGPKGMGRHIYRDVEWLYRAEFKKPRDTVYAIAQEYAEEEKRLTPAHSVVQNGIARTKQLLELIALI